MDEDCWPVRDLQLLLPCLVHRRPRINLLRHRRHYKPPSRDTQFMWSAPFTVSVISSSPTLDDRCTNRSLSAI